jgi:endonuclease YncB( thermonuclease family)
MYQYKATFVNNHDGDSTKLKLDLGFSLSLEKSVRLLGIDAPEINTGNHKDKAQLAKTWLTDKLTGKNLIVTTCKRHNDGGLDKYGRILGEIFVVGEETSVNAQIIAAGHAVAYDGGKKNQSLFDSLEAANVI